MPVVKETVVDIKVYVDKVVISRDGYYPVTFTLLESPVRVIHGVAFEGDHDQVEFVKQLVAGVGVSLVCPHCGSDNLAIGNDVIVLCMEDDCMFSVMIDGSEVFTGISFKGELL